jgi:ATP-dependent DNA helicase RecG
MSEVPKHESLTVELKSDVKKLPDRELVLAAVCLANTDGGVIWLGVEDNGRVTGLHPEHRDLTGLSAMIANRTVPPLSVRASIVEHEGKFLARIEVARSERLIASSDGTLQRRRLLADGTPECVPFLPHEFATRESDLRLADYSSLPVAGAGVADLDALERQRLRQVIERYGGDRSLLGLDDEAFDGALGLTRTKDGAPVPTVTGLLLAGREAAIREHLPTHEAAFQLLSGTDVKTNDFYRWPLVRLFERLDEQFRAQMREQEVQLGLFRVSVPSVEPRAYREAVVNALAHRDYTRLGAVHIRWNDTELGVSSPGGFVEGVTLENLLVVEPRPRNPLLADAFKRLGLAERTGRGVDLIYQGLLRYGRPAPDYSRSDRVGVTVAFSSGPADLGFLELVLEEENRTQSPLPVESLLSLSTLRTQRRVDIAEIAHAIQRPPEAARVVLERLVEAGLVQPHGQARGRTYTLSPSVYRKLGQDAGYVRQVGFDALQQEQMVKRFVREHGSIQRKDVVELCRLSDRQAKHLLGKLVSDGALRLVGQGRGARYEAGGAS